MNTQQIKLGLKANWKQFTLLVIVNAFVGGMVGMERSILPQLAEEQFHVDSKFAILSFITAFGISKAIANYFTGRLANQFGRRKLLIYGWLIAMPVPFALMFANHWYEIILANVLLGVSQGLTWSSTVVMKIDLVGEKDRGLAMGINEFAGYFAVGVVAYLSAIVAHDFGITPYPFYIGVMLSILGLFTSWLWVKDTVHHVNQEYAQSNSESLKNVFKATTFSHKTLSSVTQAGLINNLNDGMIWGLLPMLLFALKMDANHIGVITAAYPTVWGIGQLFTGKMADHFSKKKMLFYGMLMQGLAIIAIPFVNQYEILISLSAVLGLGTALVYPTFLSAIAGATNPVQRVESIGVFRLWRDLGYAIGAILSGIIADFFGVEIAIYAIGLLTVISSLVIQFRMPN